MVSAYLIVLLGLVLLATGVGFYAAGWERAYWYSFSLVGVILSVVVGVNIPAIKRNYHAAEARRMQALDDADNL